MKNKQNRGSAVIGVTLALAMLYPVIVLALLSAGKYYVGGERLSGMISVSAKGAATCINWENTYLGEFRLDIQTAANTMHNTLLQNLGNSAGVSRWRGSAGNIEYYAEIYNDFGVVALGTDRIPSSVIPNADDRNRVTVLAENPTILIVARQNGKVTYSSASLRSTDYEDN